MPLPMNSVDVSRMRASINTGHAGDKPIGDMPPDSMPVAAVASATGANETLLTCSVCLTRPLRFTRASPLTSAAANCGGALRVYGYGR